MTPRGRSCGTCGIHAAWRDREGWAMSAGGRGSCAGVCCTHRSRELHASRPRRRRRTHLLLR
eukprot:1790415-Prymnesium_polylepis.2